MACECGVENRTILDTVLATARGLEGLRDNQIVMLQDVAIIRDKINSVHKTVHLGNGQPSLVSRVAVLEMTSVERDKSEVNRNSLSISKFAFWGAVITALIAAAAALTVALVSRS